MKTTFSLMKHKILITLLGCISSNVDGVLTMGEEKPFSYEYDGKELMQYLGSDDVDSLVVGSYVVLIDGDLTVYPPTHYDAYLARLEALLEEAGEKETPFTHWLRMAIGK